MTHEDPDDTSEPQDPKDADKTQGARKERVLHTRVPAVLEQELKRLAQSWRVPVSNVVRAILEDAVAAVDVVGRRAEGNLHHVVDRLTEQRERLKTITHAEQEAERSPGASSAPQSESESPNQAADLLEGLIGFQALRLATTATCSKCGRGIRAGEEAYLGVREGAGPRVLIGAECLPAASKAEGVLTEDES